MVTFSSEAAEGKLLSKFHTPTKRKEPEESDDTHKKIKCSPIEIDSSNLPVPLLPSAQEPSYLCQWRAPQTRKHKTWDGDAILVVHENNKTCSLRSIHDGSMLITNASLRKRTVNEGDEFYVGGKEVLIERSLSGLIGDQGQNFGAQTHATSVPRHGPSMFSLPPRQKPIPASQFYSTPKSAITSTSSTLSAYRYSRSEPQSKFDSSSPDAVVMKRPNDKHYELFGKGCPIVDVVLDPELAPNLRPHQIEGVKFMYEAVTGISSLENGHASPGQGVILADEMGLGKTLQTIALISILIQQNCYFSPLRTGTVDKVLIVCPLTLVVNWKREFRKWLGRNSIGVLAVEGDGRIEVEQFVNSRQYQVLILGYERLRSSVQRLSRAIPAIGLVICDEGHRLKSRDTKTTRCFDILQTRRRILLTGTPIQNDLREFYTMVDFVYPGLFDQYSVFKRVFEDPIMRSRAQHCSSQALELGKKRNKAVCI